MTSDKNLKNVLNKWLTFPRIVGSFNFQVLLTLFYLLIVMPLGIFFRFFSDPLNVKIKKFTKSNFSDWSHPKQDLEEARRQY